MTNQKSNSSSFPKTHTTTTRHSNQHFRIVKNNTGFLVKPKAGTAPNVARKLARHSDLRETMRYSHTRRDEERQIVDRMNGFPKLPIEEEPEKLDKENPGNCQPPKGGCE
jgi:hypothetical protein